MFIEHCIPILVDAVVGMSTDIQFVDPQEPLWVGLEEIALRTSAEGEHYRLMQQQP